jgi:regulator of protease activity HflC (stomatin/prohibitin superfamily)
MQDECEARAAAGAQLRQQLVAAQHEAATRAAAAAASEDANIVLSRQLDELRGQVRTSGQQVRVVWPCSYPMLFNGLIRGRMFVICCRSLGH